MQRPGVARIVRAGFALDRGCASTYKARAFAARRRPVRANAQVAQLVEHVIENHGVAGSIPALGTIASKRLKSFTALAMAGITPLRVVE